MACQIGTLSREQPVLARSRTPVSEIKSGAVRFRPGVMCASSGQPGSSSSAAVAQLAAELSSFAEGQLVHIGETEDVVNVPTRPGVLLAATERRLPVQRLLPRIVHAELQCVE